MINVTKYIFLITKLAKLDGLNGTSGLALEACYRLAHTFKH
jgi:hypothetical protein